MAQPSWWQKNDRNGKRTKIQKESGQHRAIQDD
jgi:hypothetical protein